MKEAVVPIDIGCVPEAAASGAILLASEYSTFLIFNAQQEKEGHYVDAGLAIVEFSSCFVTKFGYPNDEAWGAIPRTRELGYAVYEVASSSWIVEIAELNRHAFPDREIVAGLRHFLFLFHDSSFECLASDLSVSRSRQPLSQVLAGLSARIAEE